MNGPAKMEGDVVYKELRRMEDERIVLIEDRNKINNRIKTLESALTALLVEKGFGKFSEKLRALTVLLSEDSLIRDRDTFK